MSSDGRWARIRGMLGRGMRTADDGAPAGVPGRRDRAALGTAIRGLADAPDLASATALIAEHAAWLLHADRVVVTRDEHGEHRVVCTAGPAVAAIGEALPASGALADALRHGVAHETRGAHRVEVAAPISLGGSSWGAMVVVGRADRVPQHAPERLAPFADLVCLAASTHEARIRLACLAGTDPLTGLGNRRTFDTLLASEVERAARHDDPLSLVLLDVDHFKSVNDRFGHQRGDRVLMEVGRRLVAIARRGEVVTRIGGEEFAWILPRTGGAGSEIAALRALRAISGVPFEGVGRLTISAGVCELSCVASADEMVSLADQMLYRAKADGRNAVRRFAGDTALAATA